MAIPAAPAVRATTSPVAEPHGWDPCPDSEEADATRVADAPDLAAPTPIAAAVSVTVVAKAMPLSFLARTATDTATS